MLDKFCFKKHIQLKIFHTILKHTKHYHQLIAHRFHNHLTLVKYDAMSSDVCCRGYIETIMENQLFRISSHIFFLIGQIETYQSTKVSKIRNIKLSPCVIIILSESVRHEIIEYPDFTISVIFQLWVKKHYSRIPNDNSRESY